MASDGYRGDEEVGEVGVVHQLLSFPGPEWRKRRLKVSIFTTHINRDISANCGDKEGLDG